MKPIVIPESYNYCSVFLTFACNLNCDYCINKYNGLHKYTHLSATDWVKGLNRIHTRKDLPITISGGEPTVYPEFYKLVNGIRSDMSLDLLTNGEFDVENFSRYITSYRFKREAPYASIRFSYHKGYTNLLRLLSTVEYLKSRNYSVGIWGLDKFKNRAIKLACKMLGIDFRVKAFLDGKNGFYRYSRGLDGFPKPRMCKPSELLIAPDGRLFRCHHDLYHGVNSYGHILDEEVKLPTDFIPCSYFGLCNPCDLKIKFNRFQEIGHCSVEIKE